MTAAYLKVSTEPKGQARGPVRDRDDFKDGSIALISLEHGLISPRDVSTGMPAGPRQHLPLTFTKETDGTSPFFCRCFARNELIPAVEIVCFGLDSPPSLRSGRETAQYKITLKKAFVHKVELVGRTDPAAQADRRFPTTERVSLVYESIHWEWLESATIVEDTFKPKSD